MRALVLIAVFLRSSFQAEIEYRANTVVNLANSALMVALMFAILHAFFYRVESLGGWSLEQMLALFGVALILEGLIDCWLYPSLHTVSENVRQGHLDLLLVRPVDSQFAVTFSNLQIWNAPTIVIGFATILYSMSEQGSLSLVNIAHLVLMLVSGIAIFYSIFLVTCTLAFWFIKIGEVWIITYALMEIGRYPVTAYPNWIRFTLTYLVPIAFISNVPAEAASGVLGFGRSLSALGIGALALASSRWFWRLSVSRYTSASS